MSPYAAEPELVEVADGVFAHVQLDGSWGLSNAGVVVGEAEVAVVDTAVSEARTRRFITSIRDVTDFPVRVVCNTHHHRDHTSGNAFFEGSTIVGHRRCREAVIRDGVGGSSPVPVADPGAIVLAPPTVVFDDAITCHVGPARIEGTYVGPAHTDNDVIYWVPEAGVLFAGDVVFHDGTPLVGAGSLAGSYDAIDRCRELRPEVVVPGHGPVGGPEILDDVEEYLRFVEDVAAAGVADGHTPLEAARRTDLGRFAAWTCSERLVANLHRAYAELEGRPSGAPIDVAFLFEEMAALKADGPMISLA